MRCFRLSRSKRLGGAFDGDVTIAEVLEHGDLGLGTFDGVDGELIVVDGEAWRANFECALERAPHTTKTPLAVVAPSSTCHTMVLSGPYGKLISSPR